MARSQSVARFPRRLPQSPCSQLGQPGPPYRFATCICDVAVEINRLSPDSFYGEAPRAAANPPQRSLPGSRPRLRFYPIDGRTRAIAQKKLSWKAKIRPLMADEHNVRNDIPSRATAWRVSSSNPGPGSRTTETADQRVIKAIGAMSQRQLQIALDRTHADPELGCDIAQ